MADLALMTKWPSADEDGCYELVVPGREIYMLSPANGERVLVRGGDSLGDGEWLDDVQWYLDFSRIFPGDEIGSKRYATTESLTAEEAQRWALEVVEKEGPPEAGER